MQATHKEETGPLQIYSNSPGRGLAVTSESEYANSDGALESLQYYCIALEDMIEVAKRYIKTQKELKSLRQVRRQMSINEANITNKCTTSGGVARSDRYAIIEDNVHDELKCPVCFEIFGDEVLQCLNGHSICSTCCNTLRECPECRMKYSAGKVRNRTVEALMGTLKIDCIYRDAGCSERLTCVEMKTHVETCSFMNKPVRSPEYKLVRRQINTVAGDTKRMEKLIGETNNRVITTKASWLRARHDDDPSVEEAVKDFRLAEKEIELTKLYTDLNPYLVP